MKALVKSRREPGLWLEDIPAPKPGINDVLIRVFRAGICGTDVHIYKWDDWSQRTIPVPMVWVPSNQAAVLDVRLRLSTCPS